MSSRRLWEVLEAAQPAVREAVARALVDMKMHLAGNQTIEPDQFADVQGSTEEVLGKLFVSEAAYRCADRAVQGFGGAGYAIAASDGTARCVVPNGTVIPNRGHYLCVNSVGYSLASYPAGNGTTATGDATYTTDIPDNAGIAIFNTSVAANFTLANRLAERVYADHQAGRDEHGISAGTRSSPAVPLRHSSRLKNGGLNEQSAGRDQRKRSGSANPRCDHEAWLCVLGLEDAP